MSRETITERLTEVLREMGVDKPSIHLERPKDPAHGDWASNVAMTLASTLRRSPRSIADEVAGAFPTGGASGVAAVEVAGPGFLNFRMSTDAVTNAVRVILEAGSKFGRAPTSDEEPVMVEFVSANPTGLLHLGHGRQAALGDALSSLLEWSGSRVTREFYYNDAGRQIERLALSVQARYHQHFDSDRPLPDDGYRGEAVTRIAADFADLEGDRWLEDPEGIGLERMRQFAVGRLREEQDRDLHTFGVRFDHYYLESSLYSEGRVEGTVAALRETGMVYEKDGAVWLKTSEFGDQKDRVMLKSDGSATYFLPDVAYHLTKWERGFRRAINVQGADHHGTVDRVRAGLRALGLPEGYPEYVLHQMVTVERAGVEVKFSKREGDYLTLRDLIEEVGVDVTRYFFLMRKPEAHLVFDLDWAADQSDKNPVYKAQYAHARVCSILRKANVGDLGSPTATGTPEREAETGATAGDEGAGGPGSRTTAAYVRADLSLLASEMERELIRQLDSFPELVDRAATHRAPHLVCDWLEQTAGQVNAWYHHGNPARNPDGAVLVDDPELRRARLALTGAIRVVLHNALTLLGLKAPERMERAESEETE